MLVRLNQMVIRVVWSVALAGAAWSAGCSTFGPNTPSNSVNRLSRAERVELFNRALDQLLLAAESDLAVVSCNAIEALVKVAPRDGAPLFEKATHSDIPIVRFAGYVALGEVRHCDAMSAIRAGLDDSHPQVRLAAAFAAYRCGKSGAARLLVRGLTESEDERVRADAATLIGKLKESRTKRWLRYALELPANRKISRVSLAINGALARLRDEDAIRRLVLYSRGTTAERAEALLILATLDHARVREDLLFALAGPEEEYLEARLIAARGLGKLGYDDGFELALRMATYTDPNPQPTREDPDRTFPVRSLAIHALAEIGDERALPVLRQLAANSEDPRLQVAASYAICQILGD